MNYCSPNSYHYTYLDSPDFFILTLHSTAIFAVPIYIFTGYIIIFETPKSMKSVKFSLLTFHCWTCFVDIVFSILVSPFALAPLYATYPMGILQWMSVGIEHQAILAMASTEAMIVSIMGLYENRFFILTHSKKWWKPVRIPWYILNYLLALAAFWPVYYLVPDQTNAKEWIVEHLPCLSPEILSGCLFIVADDATLMIHSSFIVSSFICFQILIFFIMVTRSLNQYGTQLSKKTVVMQKKFFKSIILQLVLPSFCLNLPFTYIWYSAKYKYYNQKFNNFTVILIASHGFFSSIFMLFIQSSYRKVVIDYFWFLVRCVGINRVEKYPQDDKNVFQPRISKLVLY